MTIDARLHDWQDLSHMEWNALLIGNGFSRGMSPTFSYDSLFEKARSLSKHGLTDNDERVFESFNTTNFEQVLRALWDSQAVCRALFLRPSVFRINRRYRSIKNALIHTIHAVHVGWSDVQDRLLKVRHELRKYQWVFTTNYDLLIYWALMAESGGSGFIDYLFYSRFDITNVQVIDNPTRVLYLHGALHLYTLPDGRTCKLGSTESRNLLQRFKRLPDGALPLFVTEGTAEQKLRAIRHHDYLSFAYGQFAQRAGSLVIFGQTLSDQDKHIADALRKDKEHRIAVSVRREGDVVDYKLKMLQALNPVEPLFFDATTHPLGKLAT